MAVNPLIALSGHTDGSSKIFENYANSERQAKADKILEQRAEEESQLRKLQATNEYYKGLDQREQSRLKSVIIGAAQLDGYLESGNIDGAREFLVRRRQDLGQRIAAGENVDTVDTDQALQMLQSDPKGLKELTGQSIELGQQLGFLKSATDASVGGSTGVLIDRLIKEGSAPDVAGALSLIKGGSGKGLQYDQNGNLVPINGLPNALGDIKYGETRGSEQAKVDLAANKEEQKLIGKDRGEARASLGNLEAIFPQLADTVAQLSELNKVATYTKAGQAVDSARRQLGLPATEGSIAREKAKAIVDNQVLPLLRETFGAAFTQKEGESLKATLFNPDLAPEEKDAILQAFIEQKRGTIETRRRQLGERSQQTDLQSVSDDELLKMLQ